MKILSCTFNMDTACVELKFDDGSMIAIDTIAVENEIADNMYQRSELDYLIYNDPVAYVELILNGDPETYLKTVTKIISLILKPKMEIFIQLMFISPILLLQEICIHCIVLCLMVQAPAYSSMMIIIIPKPL